MTNYTVRAYVDVKHTGLWLETEEDGFTSLKAAKARAQYFLTDDYRRACEASEMLGYACVVNEKNENVADFFNVKLAIKNVVF